MNNELKAKELYYYHCTEKSCRGCDDCKRCPKSKAIISLLMMADWKEQQMIDKSMMWLKENVESLLNEQSEASKSLTRDLFIARYKKAMEEI